MASNKVAYAAILAIALCAAVAFCPIALSATEQTGDFVIGGEENTNENATETAPEFPENGPMQMPPMNGQNGPMGQPGDMGAPEDNEMDGEDVTFTDDEGNEITIFVPYLPDGTLPERSEDGAAPREFGQNAPQMGMPGMNGQNNMSFGPQMGMNQNGPMGQPGEQGDAPEFDNTDMPQNDGSMPALPENGQDGFQMGAPNMGGQNSMSFGPGAQ